MRWSTLYNPTAKLGKGAGFAWALIGVAALTAVAAWGGVSLDGALDIHMTPKPPSVAQIIMESLVSWLSLGIMLFLISRLFRGKGGMISYLTAAGLSRIAFIPPVVLISRQVFGEDILKIFRIKGQTITIHAEALPSLSLILTALATLIFLIWAIAILYLGFKHASRMKPRRVVVAFIIGLVLAEVTSKLLIWWWLT